MKVEGEEEEAGEGVGEEAGEEVGEEILVDPFQSFCSSI